MKPIITILLITISALNFIGCRTVPNDPFAEYLTKNNLQITKFIGSTNNLEAEITLVSTLDSNHIYNGSLMMEDTAKLKDREKEQSEAREAMFNNIRTNESLQLLLFCLHEEYGGFITSARLLDSKRIRERFPDCRILSVHCSKQNPIFTQPLVFGADYNEGGTSQCFVLGNPPTVAKFITKHKQPVDTLEAARENVSLLAELQSWELCREMPSEMAGKDEATDPTWVSKWKYQEMPTSNGWQFTIVFQTDPHGTIVRSYHQFVIEVLRDGTMTIRELKYMGGIGGYM